MTRSNTTDLESFEVDCVVAGAGVVGLAVARRLAQSGRDVLIVEKADRIGSETSARNSEVIHAGLYYPAGSLKARTCVSGRRQLYTYLYDRGIPFKKCGKLIVASRTDEEPDLQNLSQRGAANDVEGLSLWGEARLKRQEPEVRAVAALHSAETGIFDSHAFMVSLLGDAEDAGATLVLKTAIASGEVQPDGRTLLTCCGSAACRLLTRVFINTAGLSAPRLARSISGINLAAVPDSFLAKGSYFSFAGRAPFRHLIYPVPEPGGLGIHLTFDLAGRVRFGPDVEWVDTASYDVDPGRADRFTRAIRRYWPGLPDGSLQPDYAGLRPKIVGPAKASADFLILGPAELSAEGHVHAFGLESPGLTAALALADVITDRLLSNP